MTPSKDLKVNILDKISRIQQSHPDLIRFRLEIHKEYRISRSFPRGSKLEAQNLGVKEGNIDKKNRWRKVERAGFRKEKLRMRNHYINVLVSLESY